MRAQTAGMAKRERPRAEGPVWRLVILTLFLGGVVGRLLRISVVFFRQRFR